MKMYKSVVICCDKSAKIFQDATAIRAALEAFGLRVHLYDLAQKRSALELLAGMMPECDYVILLCHGGVDSNGEAQLNLKVVDQADGDYENPNGWELVTLSLTPTNIPEYVKGMGRTLVCCSCGAGQEPFAQAFLEAGYKGYIAPQGNYINANAAMIFVIAFFYHLLTESRIDDEPTKLTDQEAVSLASALDADYPRGTRTFHYYS
ncbi:MAG: hypothetical protein ACRYFS_04445 [Janthinobacterium lividum]